MKKLSRIFIWAFVSFRAETASAEKTPSQEILHKCYDEFGLVPPRGKIDAFDLVETNNLDLVKCGIEKGNADTSAGRHHFGVMLTEGGSWKLPETTVYIADVIMKNRNIEMFEYMLTKSEWIFFSSGKDSPFYFSPFLRSIPATGYESLVRKVKDEITRRAAEWQDGFQEVQFFDEKSEEERSRLCRFSKDKTICMASRDFRIRTRPR